MEDVEKQRGLAFQREIFRLLSPALHPYGYALAGSGAIREYKLIDRPTDDIDLFTVMAHQKQTRQAADLAITLLSDHGYHVKKVRESHIFTRLLVTREDLSTEIDLSVDARQKPAVLLADGWVISPEDAIASKIVAMTFRGEPRDYLDGVAIYRSKIMPMPDLYDLCRNFDATFSEGFVLLSLQRFTDIDDRQFARYVDAKQLGEVRRLAGQWIDELRAAGVEPPSYVPGM
jgi:hypothetical protein